MKKSNLSETYAGMKCSIENKNFMKNLILILFFLFSNICLCQNISTHNFEYYKNDRLIKNENFSILIKLENGKIISGKIENGKIVFPEIFEKFSIKIVFKNIDFETTLFDPKILNSNCDFYFGGITNFEKHETVAEYNGMNKNDEGWEWFSRRFFIINKMFTIDVENFKLIRELDYLVIDPFELEHSIVMQKITKLK